MNDLMDNLQEGWQNQQGERRQLGSRGGQGQPKPSGLLLYRGLSQEVPETTLPEAGFTSPGPGVSTLHQGVLGSGGSEDSASVASGQNVGSKRPASKELHKAAQALPSLCLLGLLDSTRLPTSNREAWPRAHPARLRPTAGLLRSPPPLHPCPRVFLS